MIELIPVSRDLARAVVAHSDLDGVMPLPRVPDWPHADTADALRPVAEHLSPGTFLICRDGVVVGECGWTGPPDGHGEVEIGFGIAPSARRAGTGAEAVRQLIAWNVSQGAQVIRAEVRPGNAASFGLLQRLGFVPGEIRAGHVVLRWISP